MSQRSVATLLYVVLSTSLACGDSDSGSSRSGDVTGGDVAADAAPDLPETGDAEGGDSQPSDAELDAASDTDGHDPDTPGADPPVDGDMQGEPAERSCQLDDEVVPHGQSRCDNSDQAVACSDGELLPGECNLGLTCEQQGPTARCVCNLVADTQCPPFTRMCDDVDPDC